MAGLEEYTDIGGTNDTFQTTCWTQLLNAKTSNEEREHLVINNLMQLYWKPVYCYLRHKGYSNDEAKDLTQGFFSDIVLERHLFQQANPKKGKFRSFLLTALNRYVTDKHRYKTAEKRKAPGTMLALDEFDLSRVPMKIPGESPEECFNHVWIADMLEQVLLDVKQECYRNNREEYWGVFEARILLPIINGKKPIPLPDLCKKYGIKDGSHASNMMITVKRRLKKALERNMKKLGEASPTRSEQIEELFKILKN